jgi:hypothetical protein
LVLRQCGLDDCVSQHISGHVYSHGTLPLECIFAAISTN